MIDSLRGPRLSDFAHRGLPDRRDPARRIIAAGATLLLYGVLLLIVLRGFEKIAPPQMLDAPRAAIVRLLPSAPQPRMRLQDFTIRLIKPRPENAPLPQIVIAPTPAEAPKATLPATAARDTAMAGGAVGGNSAGSVNGVGTGGSGTGMAACIDAAYLEQIMRHVRRWYTYPPFAGRVTRIAYVHFVIDKSGHYKALNLMRGTGDVQLDAAAMWTMRQAEPLPAIPDRFHTDQLDGVLPIIYQGGAPVTAQQLGHGARGC